MQSEEQGLERRIEEVSQVLADRLAAWEVLRQQRHISQLQGPPSPFPSAGSSFRAQHSLSVS